MNTYVPSNIEDAPHLGGTAVTIGNFDGVHRGHREVIGQLRHAARETDLESVVVTFQPHHRAFFNPDAEPFLLTDMDEKLTLLRETQVDNAVVLPFNRTLASLSAADFLRRVLRGRFGVRMLLVGHDQALGADQLRGRDAIAPVAGSHGIEVASVAPVSVSAGVISSTSIRSMVADGRLDEAADALGAPYLLTGDVVHGHGEGRSLGYPTANIALAEPRKLMPADGIYVATVQVLHREESGAPDHAVWRPVLSAGGMLYIGSRPTFGQTGARAVEVALLDFDGDLYGSRLRLEVHARLRGDRKFDTRQELVAQIRADEEQTRQLLAYKPAVPVDSAGRQG